MTNFDPDKPVRRKNKQRAEILATIKHRTGKRLVVKYIEADGFERLECHYEDGRWSQACEMECDLENIPETREVWTNVYKMDGQLTTGGNAYQTRNEAARFHSDANIVGCNRITLRAEFDE